MDYLSDDNVGDAPGFGRGGIAARAECDADLAGDGLGGRVGVWRRWSVWTVQARVAMATMRVPKKGPRRDRTFRPGTRAAAVTRTARSA